MLRLLYGVGLNVIVGTAHAIIDKSVEIRPNGIYRTTIRRQQLEYDRVCASACISSETVYSRIQDTSAVDQRGI